MGFPYKLIAGDPHASLSVNAVLLLASYAAHCPSSLSSQNLPLISPYHAWI